MTTIFDDMELGTCPTRRAGTQRDPLEKVFERLVEGCYYQTDLLQGTSSGSGRKGKGKRRGRKWWIEEPDGTISCRIEVGGRTVVLKDGQTCAKFRSRKEAIAFYDKIVEWVSSGELDDLVREHLAKIPPRKKRT